MKSAEQQALLKYPNGIYECRNIINNHKRTVWLDGYRAGEMDMKHKVNKQAEDIEACHKIMKYQQQLLKILSIKGSINNEFEYDPIFKLFRESKIMTMQHVDIRIAIFMLALNRSLEKIHV